MNRFLLGALAMGAVFALTSFAFRSVPDPAPKRTGGPAWTVSQYQLDRAFRVQVPIPGPTGQLNSVTFQLPSTGGIIITQVRPQSAVTIAINGVPEAVSVYAQDYVDLNPPMIARPNDVVTISAAGGTNHLIAGYTTMPGET